jgi:hypothetical protein
MKRYYYEIRVEGHLGCDWSDWFEGLTVRNEADGETILVGPMDQAALHGVLAKVGDLGIPLIGVTRVDQDQTKPEKLGE